eukprot:3702806-Pleurochrysis_carterae.AAC.2
MSWACRLLHLTLGRLSGIKKSVGANAHLEVLGMTLRGRMLRNGKDCGMSLGHDHFGIFSGGGPMMGGLPYRGDT